MKPVFHVLVSLCILAFAGAVAGAQTPAPAPVLPPAQTAPPAANIARMTEAVISAVDAKANSLSLQVLPAVSVSPAASVPSTDKTGKTDKVAAPQAVFAVPDSKCRFTKNNRPALLSDFAVGEKVVVRLLYRTSPLASVVLREMADTASYAEQQKQGKEITEGKITGVSARELAVLRADGVSVTFRVSPRTMVTKADIPAPLTAYPVGATVAVKPRRLPAGNLMATVIGESAEAANRAYRDTLTTWNGLVEAVNGNETTGATIRMKRDDGAVRSFRLPANVSFKNGRGDVSWAKMVGMNVSAHLSPRAPGSTEIPTANSIKVTPTSPEDKVKAP